MSRPCGRGSALNTDASAASGGAEVTGRPAPARLSFVGAVATITLARPERLNPISIEMAACLRGLGREVVEREDAKVLLIQGEGPAFCAGGDIGLFASDLDGVGAAISELLDHYHEFLVTLRTMPQLVVTKLHGAVAGAGFSLAFMGDLALAADDARFVPGYAKLGVSPDGGGSIGVAARVGTARALRIFLAEDEFDADQAERWGLVDKVVPRADLDRVAGEMTARLTRLAPAALAETKQLVLRTDEAELRRQLGREQDALLRCAAAEPFKAAVRRFVSAGKKSAE